jgi:hypothetical protein
MTRAGSIKKAGNEGKLDTGWPDDLFERFLAFRAFARIPHDVVARGTDKNLANWRPDHLIDHCPIYLHVHMTSTMDIKEKETKTRKIMLGAIIACPLINERPDPALRSRSWNASISGIPFVNARHKACSCHDPMLEPIATR